jgi:hypothetical protein
VEGKPFYLTTSGVGIAKGILEAKSRKGKF